MSEIKISRRYASALYEFAVAEKIDDTIFNDMSVVYNSCAASKELRSFLKSPIIKDNKKLAILKEMFQSLVSDITIKFFKIIVTGRRENFIPQISKQFIDIYKAEQGIKIATIKTAVSLNDMIRKQIIGDLEKQTGAKIELKETVKEDLIGGFIISIDNKEIDTSLKHKFNQLRKEFNSNLFIRKY